ncbi:ATP-binding protein [Desulforamulus hydrothermalis]|uniref:Cobyrinic acid ac-diamide synthase n=1 Tax=Desulforamulus hydrothermalis Lam5 = DSM 18033 TaxID=1121428 RepID=K8E7G7_9FIRM|nr:ATP-binding protein [Desulforamulus hydrothermalis]CCO07453.1 Cobyrinic acid ac-diamide synthase [Desulforamulus hydrothermalis Lam5 = DSM 18033]SHH18170.1 MinD superfamily P-loop ATPase, contains an inserted ferredoxin domain [Desulforamulus hydrothermalis Lam5 = DSM 18033]
MIISVASGKGGTGKTLVATSLALSLLDEQKPVQLLDCDVEEPNAHIFFKLKPVSKEKVTLPVPRVDYSKCRYCGKCSEVCQFKAIALLKRTLVIFPDVCHSCGGCWHLCPTGALAPVDREVGSVSISEAGCLEIVSGMLKLGTHISPPVVKAVRQKEKKDNVVIIDGPPGSSCPVMAAVSDTDFCILVTEPTPFGLNDLSLAAEMLRVLKVPCGVVINRDVPGNRIIDRFCQEKGLPILLRIPFQTEIARAYAKGIPLVESDPAWREKFKGLYYRVAREVQQ